MPSGTLQPRLRAPAVAADVLADFSGGVNYRDAPAELADNDVPACLNVTFDFRGGVTKRLGHARVSTLPAGQFNGAYYSQNLGVLLIRIDKTVYKTADLVTFTSVHVFTTTDATPMADFANVVVGSHVVDGTWTYDGTAFTIRSTTAKGNQVAIWQNYAWVAGVNPGSGAANPTRVWRSGRGDPTSWTTATDWVDVRENNDLPITALHVAEGIDVVGRPGLLVFKTDSFHRIFDSGTMAYTTIDVQHGAAWNGSVVSRHGVTAFINTTGIFVTDGSSKAELASGKLAPLFRKERLDTSKPWLFQAQTYKDRMLFSLPFYGMAGTISDNHPNIEFEFDQTNGWFAPRDFAPGGSFHYLKDGTDRILKGYGTTGYLYEMDQGGADDGNPIASFLQTRWLSPNADYLSMFHRARLTGLGQNVQVSAYANYDTAVQFPLGVYGPGSEDFPIRQAVESLALRFDETSSRTRVGRSFLGGPTPEVGAWAMFRVLLEQTRLGRA